MKSNMSASPESSLGVKRDFFHVQVDFRLVMTSEHSLQLSIITIIKIIL